MKKQERRNLTTNRKQKVVVGGVFEIQIDNEYFVYGQILPHSECAIFDYKSVKPLVDVGLLNKAQLMFVVGFYNYIIRDRIWPVVGKLPIREDLQSPPPYYIYDKATNKFNLYDNKTGLTKPATKEEVKGLECAAVWDANHIVDRIRSHYLNVPCVWLKEHYELFGF